MKRKIPATDYRFVPYGFVIRIDDLKKGRLVINYSTVTRLGYYLWFGDFLLGENAIPLEKRKEEVKEGVRE